MKEAATEKKKKIRPGDVNDNSSLDVCLRMKQHLRNICPFLFRQRFLSSIILNKYLKKKKK
jgi:hypothetical protein